MSYPITCFLTLQAARAANATGVTVFEPRKPFVNDSARAAFIAHIRTMHSRRAVVIIGEHANQIRDAVLAQ